MLREFLSATDLKPKEEMGGVQPSGLLHAHKMIHFNRGVDLMNEKGTTVVSVSYFVSM